MSKTLTDVQIKETAEAHGLEPAALKAVDMVESKGSGFLPDGRPVILFEGHIFWKQLIRRGIDPHRFTFGNRDILFPAWTEETRKFYQGGAAEHLRLKRAAEINREAALSSASWGRFQVLGLNWDICGFQSLQKFINAMYRDEAAHLKAAVEFIKSRRLTAALRDRDWPAFARGYNGAGYAANQYDVKLARAYEEAREKGYNHG